MFSPPNAAACALTGRRRKLYAVSLSWAHKSAVERQKKVAKTIFFINLIHFVCKDNAFFKYIGYFCTNKIDFIAKYV